MKHRVRRRMTQSGKKRLFTVIVVLLLIFVIAAAGYYLLEKKKTLEGIYLGRINELEMHIEGNTRTAYAASEGLRAGSVITADSVSEKEILSDECGYITRDDFGKTLLIDIDEGELLFRSFLSDTAVDVGLREVEYDYIDISSNIMPGDYVDIRIVYPDGSDYIVASKKQIMGLNDTKLVTDIFCYEEEILLLDSAAVDAYLFEGTRIYVTKYILPTIQDASIVNYAPSVTSSELIRENPNIVTIASGYLAEELRRRKEEELAAFLKKDEAEARYDASGMYIGTPTDAEMKAEELFEDDTLPATELPEEYGSGLWED